MAGSHGTRCSDRNTKVLFRCLSRCFQSYKHNYRKSPAMGCKTYNHKAVEAIVVKLSSTIDDQTREQVQMDAVARHFTQKFALKASLLKLEHVPIQLLLLYNIQ